MNTQAKKNITDSISKTAIFMFARKIREIQTEQIDGFLSNIERELLRIYPSLTGSEAQDWACDFQSTSNVEEVKEVFDRLEDAYRRKNSVQEEQEPAPMYNGNADIFKQNSKFDPTDCLNQMRQVVSIVQKSLDRVTKLEDRLAEFEERFSEDETRTTKLEERVRKVEFELDREDNGHGY